MWIDDSSISCIHCTQFTIKNLILSYILCGKEDIKKILIILKPQLFSKVRYMYYKLNLFTHACTGYYINFNDVLKERQQISKWMIPLNIVLI